jgi:hypothetical protein
LRCSRRQLPSSPALNAGNLPTVEDTEDDAIGFTVWHLSHIAA